MKHCKENGNYLEVLIHSTRVNRQTYNYLFDKIKRKLSSWKANQLSLAGRTTLVHSVTSTIANYAMQSTKLPIVVAKDIDALNRNFFGMHLKGKRRFLW